MSKTVLIVDDEQDVVDYLSAVLDSCGYESIEASNADEGFIAATERKPDLICLDVMMPEESGISLYIRLKESGELKHIPVLIISGMESEQEFDIYELVRERSIPPPEEYIEKPINVDQFMQTVKAHIGMGQSNESDIVRREN